MQTLRLYLLLTLSVSSNFVYAQTQFLPLIPPCYALDPLDLKAINLEILNPVYNFISDKSKKTTGQEWMNNSWVDASKLVTNFSINCDKPTRRVRSAPNNSRTALEEVGLDTFIYENNRLSIYKKNFLGRLTEQYRFVYNGSRNTPDTVWASTFTELVRYSYTYSGNQVTAITEDGLVSTSVVPNRRVKLSYTPNGQLERYFSEKIDNGVWKKNKEYTYTYDSLNRIKKYTRFETPILTISEGNYAYNNSNQLVDINIFILGDSLPRTQILRLVYSDYNTKSYPHQVGLQAAQGVLQAPLLLYNYTYETNDSTLNRILIQQPNGPGAFVNYLQTRYENCERSLKVTEERLENVVMNVYPNPANEEIFIKTNEPLNTFFDVSIFNISGQVVQKIKDVVSDSPLSIRGLSNGIYFIRLSNAQKTGVQSFVVGK